MMKYGKILSFTDASTVFFIFTLSFLGAVVVLKRGAIYAVDYISTGKILLKEKWYSLLFIVLWGVLSIIMIILLLLN